VWYNADMKREWFRRYCRQLLIILISGAGLWAGIILVNEKNWLGISAFATLVLALIASLAILQTRDMQKSEKRERLLNEIIQWAIDIRKITLKSELPNNIAFDTPIEQMATQRGLLSLWHEYQNINAKSGYVEAIASDFRNSLLPIVKTVTQKLDDVIKALEDCLTTKGLEEKMKQPEKSLSECARIVIAEATKIWTKDIGKKEENMPRKGEATGSGKMTLKDIENHLTWQDKEIKKQSYLAGYFFGGAIVLIGITLWLQMLSQKWCIDIGFLIVAGGVFMGWCYNQQKKLK